MVLLQRPRKDFQDHLFTLSRFCLGSAAMTSWPKELARAGEKEVPTGHPDSNKFETSRPFFGNLYDIVICGGVVGKDHPREEYRSDCESQRLTASQLVFAMNRLKPGGSLVLLKTTIQQKILVLATI